MDPNKTNKSGFYEKLKLDFSEEDNNIWLHSTFALRQIIGIQGMLLPLLLWGSVACTDSRKQPLESFSHYYYTRFGSLFVISISLLAYFLIVYKGKKPIDWVLSSVAGVAALCVILFPTSNLMESCNSAKYCVTVLHPNEGRETFHLVCAGVFLLCLAALSFFRFPRNDWPSLPSGKWKPLRNKVYRICGVIMFLCVFAMWIGKQEHIWPRYNLWYEANELTFYLEAVAVESFGVAWLLKGVSSSWRWKKHRREAASSKEMVEKPAKRRG